MDEWLHFTDCRNLSTVCWLHMALTTHNSSTRVIESLVDALSSCKEKTRNRKSCDIYTALTGKTDLLLYELVLDGRTTLPLMASSSL